MEVDVKKIKTDSWDKALDALGYSYIYSKRIISISKWNRASKVLGILIPVMVGGILTTYYQNRDITDTVIVVAGVVSLIQLLISSYLSITGSDEKQSNYTSINAKYSLLNSEFESLAKFPPNDTTELFNKYNILIERERSISESNFNISDKENRLGMRYGLRNYRRDCAGCGKTPLSMNPTDCDVCGNF